MEKINLRGTLEKKGRAVYISHLDLMRTMQRALKRSHIPVWYSQGYNPHIYLNFPIALALGVESSAEPMDFSVTEDVDYDDILNRLNSVMPEGLRILSIKPPVHPNKDIGFSEYSFEFYGNGCTPSEINDAFDKMMAQESIFIEKHSKSKGIVTVDIKPYIVVTEKICGDNCFFVSVKLPAGLNMNVNSNVFTDAFLTCSKLEFDKISVKRTKILCINGEEFA